MALSRAFQELVYSQTQTFKSIASTVVWVYLCNCVCAIGMCTWTILSSHTHTHTHTHTQYVGKTLSEFDNASLALELIPNTVCGKYGNENPCHKFYVILFACIPGGGGVWCGGVVRGCGEGGLKHLRYSPGVKIYTTVLRLVVELEQCSSIARLNAFYLLTYRHFLLHAISEHELNAPTFIIW